MVSAHPSPGARLIEPAERGEHYTYMVDHFWRVERVNDDGTIDAVGSSGRRHHLSQADPALEKAGWWSRLIHRRFFPGV